MRIDGRKIAAQIYEVLKKRIELLKKKHITPHLVVILVGNDQASHAYVGQKQKRGEEIGTMVTVQMYGEDTTTEQLLTEILKLNHDPLVHGIVVQQPLPSHIDAEKLIVNTDPKKDVDGFQIDSSFTPPIAEAAMKVLEEIYSSNEGVLQSRTTESRSKESSRLAVYPESNRRARSNNKGFLDWLSSKRVAVVGKGETGGAPIIAKIKKLGVLPRVIDSKTEDPLGVMQQADIIISCVGKSGIIQSDMLKKEVILIGIGMYRGDDGKLHGDYEEEEIKNIASYYTPIPGGIGPINVAMLLQNVLLAAER